MSNRVKRRKSKHQVTTSEKPISYGTVIGLILGLALGTTIFLLTDNMFWMALLPIICLFIGLGVGSYVTKMKKIIKKQSKA